MSRIPLGILAASGAAAGNALTLISTTLVSTATSSVTLSSIPSGYKHLQIRFTARSAYAGSDNIRMQVNGDTGNNYANHALVAEGSGSPYSQANAPWNNMLFMQCATASSTANAYSAGIAEILDYSSTSKYKTQRLLGGQHAGTNYNYIYLGSGFRMNTAAITSLTFYMGTGSNIVAGSRFSLYGVS